MFVTRVATPELELRVVAEAVIVADVLGVEGLAFCAYKDHVYVVLGDRPVTVA
jgi:hypothetical protein